MQYTPTVEVIKKQKEDYSDIFNQIKNKQKESLANKAVQEEARLIQQIKLQLEKWDGLAPISVLMKVTTRKEATEITARINSKGLTCFYSYDDYDHTYTLTVKTI